MKRNQLRLPLITKYARGMYLIDSTTRPEIQHLIDLEGFDGEPAYCSCEAFTIGKERPCRHITLLAETFKELPPCIQKQKPK